ncbi:Thiol-disulfide isomerase or thioredoxin [Chitinophaga sp. YR573]|uniref:TlpA disulfide reductase family protein n=1 Tax=Chitinophaga sp. YR573 TaxID=1881040 RepID=UPI0008CE3DE7|nr:TlpA disulfide reductase family protein [Chitinophaga sp. YR573]SEW34471.1 Thiol-disulfide isomerase or thioredoxin [Chitinophaga sp. YR573]
MTFRRIIILAIAIGTGSLASAQTEKNLSMTPDRPERGQQITFTYRPDSAMLATGKPVKAVAYYYDTTYRWSVADIPLDKDYKATLQLPPAAGFVVFKFRAGDVTDNNRDSGYYRMLYFPGNVQGASTYAGYCLLRATRYNMGIPNYFNSYNISDTAVYFWIGNEVARFHGAGRPLAEIYIRSLANMEQLSNGDPSTLPALRKAASYLLHLPDATEKELYTTAEVYEKYMKEPAVADSLRAVMQQRYPNGILQKKVAYKTASAEKDPAKRVLLWKQFVKDFPASYALDQAADVDYNKVYRDIFAISIANNDTAVLRTYVGNSSLVTLALAYYKMVEIPYDDWKTMPANRAYSFSQPIMDRFYQLKKTKPTEYWYYSPEEWNEYTDKMFTRNYITHASILKETGRDKEALELATYAQQLLQYSNATLNEIQAALLQKAGKKKELSSVLHNSVRLNQASGVILDMLKKEYGKSEGFDAYLAAMKDANTMKLMKEQVKEEMVNEPAAPFTLKDLNGKEVSLSAQAGKVVVLDFWATWCAPCKAGMPGMQMAQEHFKNDSNVVFYFVDTQERDPAYKEKVTTFIKEKKYPFKVLFDNGDEFYKAYATLIKTSGIPFKVVIDGKGNIRFAAVGYKGSPSGLADEMITMIELAK